MKKVLSEMCIRDRLFGICLIRTEIRFFQKAHLTFALKSNPHYSMPAMIPPMSAKSETAATFYSAKHRAWGFSVPSAYPRYRDVYKRQLHSSSLCTPSPVLLVISVCRKLLHIALILLCGDSSLTHIPCSATGDRIKPPMQKHSKPGGLKPLCPRCV